MSYAQRNEVYRILIFCSLQYGITKWLVELKEKFAPWNLLVHWTANVDPCFSPGLGGVYSSKYGFKFFDLD